MYRGSSFLLKYAYTVHRDVVNVVAKEHFNQLWESDLGAGESDIDLEPHVHSLIDEIRDSYRSYAQNSGFAQPTDTLVTKVILGTFGCLPACDRYFIDGFRFEGFKFSRVNNLFIRRLLDFCNANLDELQQEQAQLELSTGLRYPLMKLVDMYFWQVGLERSMAE